MKTKELTYRESIMEYYKELHNGSVHQVKECSMTTHPLYEYRLGELPEDKTYRDRITAIRKTCIDCCGGNKEVNECIFTDCHLYKFRNPRQI